VIQDWVSVWAFRRDFDARNLVIMIPGSLVGVGRIDLEAVLAAAESPQAL